MTPSGASPYSVHGELPILDSPTLIIMMSGWIDASGNGTWAVAIRCAELSEDRKTARIIAGGGIVAASDPNAELAETQAKFQAMLSAIVRP